MKRLEEDMRPVFPGDKIACATCAFKKPGVIGYKIDYCAKYPTGKPFEVLFKDAPCKKYKKESAEK